MKKYDFFLFCSSHFGQINSPRFGKSKIFLYLIHCTYNFFNKKIKAVKLTKNHCDALYVTVMLVEFYEYELHIYTQTIKNHGFIFLEYR